MADTRTHKPVIEVEDYYDKIHRNTWGRRTAGLIGGAMVGTALGGIIGTIAAFIPYIFGAIGIAGATAVAAPGIAAIAGTAAVFAGVIGLMGSAGMAVVGADTAATASGLAEKERREKAAKLGLDPNSDMVLKDPPPEKMPRLFNWKVAAVTVPMMMAFGALVALSPLTASTIGMMGFAGATATTSAAPAAIAASASVFGMFGAVFGMKMSYVTNKASNFAHSIITGKIFEKSRQEDTAAATRSPENVNEVAEASPAISAPEERRSKNFATEKTRFSLQGIIEKSEERGSESDVVVTR